MIERRANPGPEPLCWKCGAPNAPGSSECWLCQRPDWNRHPIGFRNPISQRRQPTIASGMIWIAIIAVTVALFRDAPGLAIFLIVLAAIAMAMTAAKARRREAAGDPMPMIERVARVVALMFLIPILGVLALAIALVTFCLFIGAFR